MKKITSIFCILILITGFTVAQHTSAYAEVTIESEHNENTPTDGETPPTDGNSNEDDSGGGGGSVPPPDPDPDDRVAALNQELPFSDSILNFILKLMNL